MADAQTLTREFVIPLRRHWHHVATYERAGKAVKAIKAFVAKHMKVIDRDVNNVKLDVLCNNEVWFRGKESPPAKIKVKAVKEGDIVKVTFAQEPQHITFLKAKHARFHQPAAQKEQPVQQEKPAQSAEQKTAEQEKAQATAIQHQQDAQAEKQAAKHTTKVEKKHNPQRMALKK